MADRFPTHPLFTVRTHELAGRSAEQQTLRAAVEQLYSDDLRTQLFYIAGDGGMGKTRLLEWLEQGLSHKYSGQESPLICTRIIDFYSSHVRISLDLIETIAEDIRVGLDGKYDVDKIFHDFDSLIRRFRSQQNAAVPSEIRHQVMSAFDTAWKALEQEGCRLVVRLDTAELLRFHDDPVRQRFDAPLPVAASWNWLKRTVEQNDLPGVLFVVAGRRKEASQLDSELCKLAGGSERIIELGGFSKEGVAGYIQELSNTLAQQGYHHESRSLTEAEGFDDALVAVFHKLTGGLPIALAIALQLYLDRTPPHLMVLIDELLEGKDVQSDMQAVVRDALVQALGEYAFGQDASVIVRYMALARRGLTPERFRAVWKGVYEFSNSKADFIQLQQQIFVKTRPDGSLVLHDKIADWLEAGFYRKDQEKAASIFHLLVEEYNREIKILEDMIVSFNQRINVSDEEIEQEDMRSLSESTASRPVPTPEQLAEERELFKARERRRHLTADRMNYALRWDAEEGYKHYYELAEEIFSVGQREAEAHVRAVFLEWWDAQDTETEDYRYRHTAAKAGITAALVEGDFALRAVQRAYTEQQKPLVDRLHATLDLITRILDANDFQMPQHTRILLEIYANLCRGQLEGEQTLQEMRTAFDSCMKALEQEKRIHGEWHNDLQGWLIHAARAFGYYAYGFFERSRGHYGRAAKWYTASLKPYRDLKFEVSQARSLNDKAYVLALVGDSVNAEAVVKDALELRLRLGYGYPIALSHNTYGIVLTMNERPVSAEYHCLRALEIFRKIDSRYGQMLAHRALSEAYRRDAERIPLARLHYLRHLESALEASDQSNKIAQELLRAPNSLLSDILDEYGCVYRDLARFCWENPDECTNNHNADKSFEQAEDLLRKSIEAVAGIEASERRVDSAINLAYLHFWKHYSIKSDSRDEKQWAELQEYFDQAERYIQEAISYVPAEYRDPTHPQHPQKEELTGYWALLNKAWSLAAMIAQERRLLAEGAGKLSEDEERRLEDELARAVIRILYFADRMPGNVRSVRRALQAAYNVLKPLSSKTLERFYDDGALIFPEHERGDWGKGVALLRAQLEENFGLGEFSFK